LCHTRGWNSRARLILCRRKSNRPRSRRRFKDWERSCRPDPQVGRRSGGFGPGGFTRRRRAARAPAGGAAKRQRQSRHHKHDGARRSDPGHRLPDEPVVLDGGILARDGASGTLSGSVTTAAPALFVNPSAGDLHLAPTATSLVDRAAVLANAATDWDGQSRPRGAAADAGADEYVPSAPPSTPKNLGIVP